MHHHPSLKPGKALNLRWRYTEPTYVTTHPLHLNPAWFKAKGIRGVIFDFDNTLISNHSSAIGEHRGNLLDDWIRTFGKSNVMIVSNKIRIFGMSNKLEAEAARFDIQALSTGPFIKPFPGSLKRAAAIMELPSSQILMIGDLLLADILGGKLAGMHTLLIAPVHTTERLSVRFIRMLERLVGYHAMAEHDGHNLA
jgi:hypothetical protein